MSGWPWPLNGVQDFFESLWNWISEAAVNAVAVVSSWIWDAISWVSDRLSEGLAWVGQALKDVIGPVHVALTQFVTTVWNSLGAAINTIGAALSNAVSGAVSGLTSVLGQVHVALTGFVTNVWNSLSGAIGAVGNTLGGAITSLGQSVGGALGNLWTQFLSLLSDVANGINAGINAAGSAVGSAVGQIGGWVSEALKGVAQALGQGLQSTIDWLWKGMGAVASTVGGFLTEHVLGPIGSALQGFASWVASAVVGFFQSILQFFASPRSPDPQNPIGSIAETLTTVLGFTLSMAVPLIAGELVHPLKEMGLGQVSAMMYDMAGFGRIASALTMELATISYITPLRYALNQLWRPRIPATSMADQMLFEENITVEQWREIYQKTGWKDPHIDAWYKTMWREPSILVLRAMASDPDTDPEWLRKKMRELGYIGADAEAILDYGKRQAVKDERTALATQLQTDFLDGVLTEADMRVDLASLKFSAEEIEYRVAKAYMMKDRNERRAVIAAAKVPKPKARELSESDLERELELGLITPERFVSELTLRGFSEDGAKRKLVLETTPRPISAEELARRKRLVETRIARTRRRYEFVLARHDLQTAFLADTIEYLSSLEKPPEARIVTLQAQLAKAADEKVLIIEQRDAELEELEGELKLVQGG